jgi:outer membrane protein OmpA-like peptidoglycan-associated protein
VLLALAPYLVGRMTRKRVRRARGALDCEHERGAMKYLTLLLCGLSLLSSASARAEELSVDQMICALDPQCSPPAGDRRMRGISATSPVTAAARPAGSFDITLNFPYNSTELTAESRGKLEDVAKALTDSSTNAMDIVISGHTDARGSADYNLRLSERRAQAVRQFLITEKGISAGRLVAKGYGKTQLLLPSDPNNELNRRVQFQNAKYATASSETPSAPERSKPTAQKSKSSSPVARPASSGGDGF